MNVVSGAHLLGGMLGGGGYTDLNTALDEMVPLELQDMLVDGALTHYYIGHYTDTYRAKNSLRLSSRF